MNRLVWFALVLMLLAAAFVAGTKFATRETVFAASADGTRVAWAADRRCWSGPCQTLWIGAGRGNATKVATLEGSERCDEIVWTKDGSRVAFLIDGAQLHLYDPSSMAPAGQITLLQPQGGPSQSVVRGVTFSDNGRAITYDECPRGRSGCRAGLAAVPK
jgi:Tol biopolymer transport system component